MRTRDGAQLARTFRARNLRRLLRSNPAPATKSLVELLKNAALAQLVERNLAKVEVTSSNLVCRSKF